MVSKHYSMEHTETLLGVDKARLRYWAQTGLVGPSIRKRGRRYYTFQELIRAKAAAELTKAGISIQRIRKAIARLSDKLEASEALTKLRVVGDANDVVVVDNGVAYEPESGQLVMDFTVESLGTQADMVAFPVPPGAPTDLHTSDTSDGVPQAIDADEEPTQPEEQPTAYRYFLQACQAEDSGALRAAEACYCRALELEPGFAAALTNLGNLRYAAGDVESARCAYEKALEIEPTQPEARFNLGNVLEDIGDTEAAIAQLRRVVSSNPEYADAHYNLGLLLARVGGVTQARNHLRKYLEFDQASVWATRSRDFLSSLGSHA